ncbi:dimethylsulfonioproprionate lyase family protein [Paracoccus aminovorans]|uniref:dimethylsulfonioproprionate lyase family protein n=1 Tax=Paracoccus aminovorans TaxID=34004 RepID=UPI002B25F78D|nr:dimethylsulfonioproprionate lyase family protein [Paracoccus aminovorans]
MTRPAPLQSLLDAALPALRARAHDGDSPASVERIAAAWETVAAPGAKPARLPVCEWFDRVLDDPPEAADLAALFAALRELSPLLCWRRHSGGDTASANLAESHANAMLLGPGGIEDRRDLWLGLSVLAPQTRYPDHHHAPEETYLVLSPGQFRHGDSDWFEPGMGGSFYNPPGIVHAMRSGDAPLFALWALWA